MHVDAILTNMSVQYKNADFIWNQLMPVVKVNKRSDLYFVYNQENAFHIANSDISETGMANEIDWGLSNDNYSVVDHALADWVSQAAIDNADVPLQPRVDTNDFLNGALDLEQEKRVADIVFNASSYASNNKIDLNDGSNTNFGEASDDPIGVIMNGLEVCLQRPNLIVMGPEVWQQYRKLPEVLDAVKSSTRFQGSPGGLATVNEVAGLFEVDNILVPRARYNTAKPGQSASLSRVWGKHIALVYVAPNPGIKSLTFGVTFQEMTKTTYTDFDGKRGIKGAEYIKVAYNSDEKVIANDVGYFIAHAVN
jgi:hypothetical protein